MKHHEDDHEPYSRPISLALVLRLFKRLLPYRRSYALVCLCGLLVAGLEMLPPRLVGRTINEISSGGLVFDSVIKMALAWALIAALTQVMHGMQIWLANRAGENVLCSLREELFARLQSLSMSYYDRTHVGRIIARVGGDVDSLRMVLIWGLNTIVANAAIMVFSAGMILATDAKLFLSVAWLAPVLTVLNFVYAHRMGAEWQKVRRHSTLVGANQAENIAGAKVVAAFNRQAENLERYDELQKINTENNVAASRMSGIYQPVLQWIRFLGQGIILLYGGYRVSIGTLQAGDLAAVSLYWEWFMQPTVSFGVFFNDLLIAMAGAERIFSLLDEEPEIADSSEARPLPRLRGEVRFEEVTFAYRNGKPVLRDVSFQVRPGSTVALVGATGSGKSTIISLLARFYQPQSGRILVDGHDLRLAQSGSYHRQLAMVLQMNYLFTGTVMENLRYARPDATDEEIIDACRRLGCHERFSRLKLGYQTPVAERGASLSLGERQLLCIARAMVASPSILLLDEATSAVDLVTELQIQDAMSRLSADRTTFVVAHRLSTIQNADCILVLQEGRIVESGNHEELLERNGRYAELCHQSKAKAKPKVASKSKMNTSAGGAPELNGPAGLPRSAQFGSTPGFSPEPSLEPSQG